MKKTVRVKKIVFILSSNLIPREAKSGNWNDEEGKKSGVLLWMLALQFRSHIVLEFNECIRTRFCYELNSSFTESNMPLLIKQKEKWMPVALSAIAKDKKSIS